MQSNLWIRQQDRCKDDRDAAKDSDVAHRSWKALDSWNAARSIACRCIEMCRSTSQPIDDRHSSRVMPTVHKDPLIQTQVRERSETMNQECSNSPMLVQSSNSHDPPDSKQHISENPSCCEDQACYWNGEHCLGEPAIPLPSSTIHSTMQSPIISNRQIIKSSVISNRRVDDFLADSKCFSDSDCEPCFHRESRSCTLQWA